MTPRVSRREYIHAQMSAIYFARWTGPIGSTADTAEMRAWAADMGTLTMAQIDAGLAECRRATDEWPPTPAKFKSWCLGIPPFATVKRETLGPAADRSQFTRAVWARVDHYQHRIASVRDGDRMLEAAYNEVRDAVMRGEPLPNIAGVLEHDESQKPKPAPLPVTREARAERLRQILGPEYNPATADPNYDPHKAHRDEARTTLEADLELRRQLYSATSTSEE